MSKKVWDSKPPRQGDPVQWVELKTTAAPRPPAEDRHGRDRANYERKLLKWWAQSFLLGVPRLVVGVRSRDGVLLGTEDLDVAGLPAAVARGGPTPGQWDGNVCINFAAEFLECAFSPQPPFPPPAYYIIGSLGETNQEK